VHLPAIKVVVGVMVVVVVGVLLITQLVAVEQEAQILVKMVAMV